MAQSLGRGLGSLIPNKNYKADQDEGNIEDLILKDEERIIQISPKLIKTNPYQPRNLFSESALKELMDSIAVHGIFQPLIVTRLGVNFQLIAGERRLRAALELGLEKVPVIIRKADEQKKFELALIENLQREDLNPIENALAFRKLMTDFNLSQEEAAKKVGKARSSLANTLRLLNLPEEIQTALLHKKISEAHAKMLLSIEDKGKQRIMFNRIVNNNLSVADANLELDYYKKNNKNKIKINNHKDNANELKLQEFFATKVKVKRQGKRGKIEIDFYSDDELNEIIKKIIK